MKRIDDANVVVQYIYNALVIYYSKLMQKNLRDVHVV
jgi:hypothetical protein